MNFEFLFSLLGIILTFIFGIYSLYFFYTRKNKRSITVYMEDIINLYDDILKNRPSLSVKYNGQTVSKNLVLIKGTILNTGKRLIVNEFEKYVKFSPDREIHG